jgi:hypothetical protein
MHRFFQPGSSGVLTLPPLGMPGPGQLVPDDGGVDWRADAGLVRGGDHLAQEVAFETGVRHADLGGVVAITMMALSEDGNRIDVCGREGGSKLGRDEVRTHIGNMR